MTLLSSAAEKDLSSSLSVGDLVHLNYRRNVVQWLNDVCEFPSFLGPLVYV